ncbi:MAG: hypothetical protein IH576_00665 [Deltaproteobacteria bacterium]|nr:hypothetical protein [Deltaproteobacteria bacterium]
MTTNRKPAALLALLLSCLMAIPPAAWADDTELFTTTANPNVLLMLDTTGSMDFAGGGTSVGNLDGTGNTNSRMDILWKVVYSLLNADLSTPGTSTATGRLRGARRSSNSYWDTSSPVIEPGIYYNRIRVDDFSSSEWSLLDSTGTLMIGAGGVTESLTYTSKAIDYYGNRYFTFTSRTFVNTFNMNATVTYQESGTPYPTDHTEAMSSAFLNNLTQADEEILKARLGLMTFSTSGAGLAIYNQINPSDSNAPPFTTSYQDIWGSVRDEAYPNGGTPTAKALRMAQTFFSTATSNNTVDICRPNFAVLITDGEDTIGGLNGATGNGYGPNYYCGGSFNANGWSCGYNTGQVARHNSVVLEAASLKNFSPSVELFTVGVGIGGADADLVVQRDVLRRAAEQLNAQATNTQYNTIGGLPDNTSRGAGRAFFASDAAELTTALRNVFHQISAGVYSFTAPTVASVRMTDRNYLYKASFQPAAPPDTFWPGKLEAMTINNDNTFTTHWDAGEVLRSTAPSSRRIFSGDNTSGSWGRIDFDTTDITAAMLGVGSDGERDNVVNYVRGENHDNNAKLGDIFHSKPVVVGPPSRFYFDEGYSTAVPATGQSFVDAKATRKRAIFVGTNDGMLHGFLSGTYNSSTKLYDSGTGEELFGYVPNHLLPSIREFLPADLTLHGYHVDSSPRVADVWIDDDDGVKESAEWKTILIGGMRKGGRGYFALDVTDPPDSDYTNYPVVKWEYADPAVLGETWSEPVIGKVKIRKSGWTGARDRWVAVFGGGMSGDNVANSLIVLDIATGTPLKTFTAGIDNSMVASPTMLLDPNGYIKFIYLSDLDGSLYKFDLRSEGLESDGYAAWGLKKIFQSSSSQPVFHRTEPGVITENLRYLYFGTGNQESPVSETGIAGTGKFYAIKDTDAYWPASPLTEANLANLTGNLTTGTAVPTDNGWYLDLWSVDPNANGAGNYTHSGEKVLSDPVVFYNNVYFTTFTPNAADPCGGGGIARVYGINMINAAPGLAALPEKGETAGGKVAYHVYSGNPEGGIPSSPSLSVYPAGQSSIFIGFSTGAVKEIQIESPGQSKNIKSWKETF